MRTERKQKKQNEYIRENSLRQSAGFDDFVLCKLTNIKNEKTNIKKGLEKSVKMVYNAIIPVTEFKNGKRLLKWLKRKL